MNSRFMANSQFKFVQLSSYTSPVISENSRKGWVEYGEDNNYFQYLIDRYNGSPTNNAVVSGVIDMIFGKGIDATDSAKNPEGYLELRRLIKDEELKKVVNDYYMLGNGAFQLIYNQNKTKIVEVYHMPVETLRAEKCNEEGEVEAYYYAYDWSEVRSKKGVDRIPAFGYGSQGDKIEILYFRPYRSGSYYYSPVDYQGALPYAELEGEVANYHINNIKNGLAPSMIVNFNNGVPPEEERDIIESQIKQKWSGSSNAGKFILAFNDSSDTAASIEPVQLSDAHNQYEFLSRESQQKILVGHRITSPMLFGVKDQTGLGNNADEIKTAFTLFDNSVIRPKQNQVINALDQILAFNNVSLNLYFSTLAPLEFTEVSDVQDQEVIEEETGVKMNAHPEFTKEDEKEWLEYLADKGEDIDEDEWELTAVQDVEDPDREDEIVEAITSVNMAAVSSYGNPEERSSGDAGMFKIRYRYTGSLKDNSRTFCVEMVGLSDSGKVYRKEDINQMSFSGVNGQFAPKGRSTYSIFKYKGGAYCHHKWQRLIFMRKRDKGKFLPKSKTEALENDRRVAPSQAASAGVPDGKINPKDYDTANTRPIDMPNRGKLN
jgi:hypothetical protein